MSNELQDEELDIDIPLVDLEADTVICPQCKNVVPVSLYCVTCNSPLEVNGGESSGGSEEEIEKFDVESLRGMMGEGVVQIEENMEKPSSNNMVGSNDMKFKFTPIKHELTLPDEEPFGMSLDELDEVRVKVDPMDVASRGKDNEIDTRIKQLADDLFKSIYLELWSIKLLEKSEIDEAHVLRLFRGYRERLEGCIAQRDHFLEKYGELEKFDNEARDSRIELQELEVRRGLGDLAKGEYEALAPALRWAISFNESEKDRRENLLVILEDLSRVMPREGILEIKSMTEYAERMIDEIGISNRLSQEIVDEVGDSIKRINGLLSVKVKDLN
jgi:hypothetical protein